MVCVSIISQGNVQPTEFKRYEDHFKEFKNRFKKKKTKKIKRKIKNQTLYRESTDGSTGKVGREMGEIGKGN